MAGHNSGRVRTFLRKVSTGSSRPQTATSIFHFHMDTSAVSLASRQRSIAVFLCYHAVALFLRIIAPGVCLSEDIVTNSDRLLLSPRERLMG